MALTGISGPLHNTLIRQASVHFSLTRERAGYSSEEEEVFP